jgi:uncharacterized protein YndB with AHSA1/START domain
LVGHRFQFRTTPHPGWDGIIEGEVLTVEPFERLVYRWETWGKLDTAPDVQTTVTWTLETVQGGTRVRMEQAGFRLEQTQALEGARYGWNGFLKRLKNVLAEET